MIIFYTLIIACAISIYCRFVALKQICTNNDNTTIKNKFKITNVVLILIIVMMILIFACRAISVGADTATYQLHYKTRQRGKFEINKYSFEIGFEILLYICKLIGLNFNGFLFIASLIMFVPLYFFYRKYSINPVLSLFLYITMGIFSMSFNGTRQFIAFTIFLISIKFILNKNFIGYILCIALAYLFHSSALVLLPIYVLRYIKINIVTALILVSLSLFCFFNLENIVKFVSNFTAIDYFERYFIVLDLSKPLDWFNVVYCSIMASIFIVLVVCKKKILQNYIDKEKEYNLFLLIFLMFVIIRICATFSNIFSLINRLNMYFYFPITILLPYLLTVLNKRWLKHCALLTYLICGIVYFSLSAIVRYSNEIYPYELIFKNNVIQIIFFVVLSTIGIISIILSLKKNKKIRRYYDEEGNVSIWNTSRSNQDVSTSKRIKK